MEIDIAIGTRTQSVCIPEGNLRGVLLPNAVPAGLTGEAEVRRALAEPIASPRLSAIVRPGEKIAIVTSDITRPMPTALVLPPLLDELYAAGARAEDIVLVFALGSHRGHTPGEMKKLAGGRAFAEIRCMDGDRGDCVRLGVTPMGTPVDVTRVVAEADRRICLGNIEYHYFAGYSGGAKAIMPGVSTREAIQANHSRMVDAAACAGRLEGNPVREDIEAAGALCGIDFLLNVVLDEKKRVVKAVAGDAVLAHREGCRFLDALYGAPVRGRADIVIASQGGAPKDLNLYQTQKALDNAKHAVRRGGVIILVGSCVEGAGESVFEEWLLSAPDAASLVARIRGEFCLGGHKAAAIALVLAEAEIFLVSELPSEFVRRVFMRPFVSVQEALDAAFGKIGHDAGVLVMPHAGSTLPRCNPA